MATTVRMGRLNSRTIKDYLDGGHGVEAKLATEAERIAAAARAAAPVDTGAYRASIHVETDRTDRMRKRVIADVPYALVVEAEHGPLGKAI